MVKVELAFVVLMETRKEFWKSYDRDHDGGDSWRIPLQFCMQAELAHYHVNQPGMFRAALPCSNTSVAYSLPCLCPITRTVVP